MQLNAETQMLQILYYLVQNYIENVHQLYDCVSYSSSDNSNQQTQYYYTTW